MKTQEKYRGFEQGPIRPPSEAYSLLIRITRNCPWNRCTFCPVYKDTRFSLRPVDHVIEDIDRVYNYIEAIKGTADESGSSTREAIRNIINEVEPYDDQAYYAALEWYFGGKMRSVFLQDANSPVIKTIDLVKILEHLRNRFPGIERITSYARSHTIARKKDEDIRVIADAGLNRIHIGMESGSDKILERVDKGTTKEHHIRAGLKVKNAGMELSEYYMPGLGGEENWKENALETADALNKINPDFIRLRTLALPERAPLAGEFNSGSFRKCSELTVVKEILLFIKTLEGITSCIKSDHILNLFEDFEGVLPADSDKLINMLESFLAMQPEKQSLYQLGRRLGYIRSVSDMDNPDRLSRVEAAYRDFEVTPENVDDITTELMKRFT
ncbi:MAG: radical SAM protein [bacterium]|nr:radical SAM protein [bacterium]